MGDLRAGLGGLAALMIVLCGWRLFQYWPVALALVVAVTLAVLAAQRRFVVAAVLAAVSSFVAGALIGDVRAAVWLALVALVMVAAVVVRRGGFIRPRCVDAAWWGTAPRDDRRAVREIVATWDDTMYFAGLTTADTRREGMGFWRAHSDRARRAERLEAVAVGDAGRRITPTLVSVTGSTMGYVLTVTPARGHTAADWHAHGDHLSMAWGVAGVSVNVGRSGSGFVVVDVAVRDPLAVMEPLTAPLPWRDGEWDAVPYGYRADGSTATVDLRNRAGMVVGGMSGHGKTAGLSCLMASLVASPSVQFVVIDGKGGSDWEWIRPRASVWLSEDEPTEEVAAQMEGVVSLMSWRVRMMRSLRGVSSLWEGGGPDPDTPLVVFLVDECQTFFDKNEVMKTDKAKQDLQARCVGAVTKVMKKGRSVGFVTIPATQKPTSDSLPTAIGTTAGLAYCFGVKTPEAERATLGTGPADGEPTATSLFGGQPGYAVAEGEHGRALQRFGFIPEHVLEGLAAQYAHLRKDIAPPVRLVADEDEDAS